MFCSARLHTIGPISFTAVQNIYTNKNVKLTGIFDLHLSPIHHNRTHYVQPQHDICRYRNFPTPKLQLQSAPLCTIKAWHFQIQKFPDQPNIHHIPNLKHNKNNDICRCRNLRPVPFYFSSRLLQDPAETQIFWLIWYNKEKSRSLM